MFVFEYVKIGLCCVQDGLEAGSGEFGRGWGVGSGGRVPRFCLGVVLLMNIRRVALFTPSAVRGGIVVLARKK